jgi:putative intracellular protease/amidase
MKILVVLTSDEVCGNTGPKTGYWLEEFAAPYFVFRDAGVQLRLASPKGGQAPFDPKSDLPENQTAAMTRFKQDQAAQETLPQTAKLADVKSEDYDTVFYPGGHGPMWDLAESAGSIALLESFYNSGKPIVVVCHSPGVLRHVVYQGAPLVKGKHVTGFTNGEEEEMELTHDVPFLVEDELLRAGGPLLRSAPIGSHFPSLTAVSLPAESGVLDHRSSESSEFPQCCRKSRLGSNLVEAGMGGPRCLFFRPR